MADGTLSRSLVGSSDILYDFICTPCSEDGNNNEAVNFCTNCQRYFCQICVKHHNKVLKTHTVLDKDDMKSVKFNQQGNVPALLPADYCEEHAGNILQVYCGQHDTVCCTVCIAINHRVCSGIDFIPKIAEGILKGPERHTIKTSLSNARSELDRVKSGKVQALAAWYRDRDSKLKSLQDTKLRLIARIEQLEHISTQKVQAKYKNITDDLEMEIELLDDTLKKLESKLDDINLFKGNNEAQFFVNMNSGKKLEISSKKLIGKMNSKKHRNISFEFNSYVEEQLFGVESLGQVIEVGDTKLSFAADYNVKIKSDKQTCNIGDISMLENGEYIVTDYDNQKLKRLDKTWHVIDTFDIRRPLGVCNTVCMNVAVTSYEEMNVRIISVGATMSQVRLFDTKIPCKGIIHSRSQLFVSCGIIGHPGEIRIYDMKGVFMSGFKNDSTGASLFDWINHLCFDPDNLYLYVADQDNGLIILDRKGSKISTINDPRLKFTHGVCTGDGGNLFVCGVDSNNVLELDKNGVVLQEMLIHTGSKSQRPAAVKHFRKQRSLVVTCVASDIIKVYHVT